MDFTGYRIYIENDGCAGMLIEPNSDLHPLDKEFLFPFDEGIKKLQEENRAMWLPRSMPEKREVSKYFKDAYGIYAV